MRSEAEATLQFVYQAGDFTEKSPSFSRTSKGDLREHGDQCNNTRAERFSKETKFGTRARIGTCSHKTVALGK